MDRKLFDDRTGRGTYLGNADPETRDKIIAKVRAWWAAEQASSESPEQMQKQLAALYGILDKGLLSGLKEDDPEVQKVRNEIRRLEAALLASNSGATTTSLTVQLLDAAGKPLEKQSLVMLPLFEGYPRGFARRAFWADSKGKVTVDGLAPGKQRFVVSAESSHPTFAEFDVPPGGLETRLAVGAPDVAMRPDLDVKVRQRTVQGKVVLDAAVSNNTDQPYTLTEMDLQLVSLDHRVFPPKSLGHAGKIVPPKGQAELAVALDWQDYVDHGRWCQDQWEGSWKTPVEPATGQYFRVTATLAVSFAYFGLYLHGFRCGGRPQTGLGFQTRYRP